VIYCFGSFELDADCYELRAAGVALDLQPKVLDTLLLLVRSRNRVVLRRELLEVVWGEVAVSEASVTRVIVEVRRALGQHARSIVTLRGRGYRFTGEVTEVESGRRTRPSVTRFVGRDACLAALGAKLEEAQQLYREILEADLAAAASSLASSDRAIARSEAPLPGGSLTGSWCTGTTGHRR
jgi:DNA-binding winged helix-turn-helix (wHTH) protein